MPGYAPASPSSPQSDTTWRLIPTGTFRFKIGTPSISDNRTYGYTQVNLPLDLIEDEIERINAMEGPCGPDEQQGTRVTYRQKIANNPNDPKALDKHGRVKAARPLGWYDVNGQYQATILARVFAAAWGQKTAKDAWKWLQFGGGPNIRKVSNCPACQAETDGPCLPHYGEQWEGFAKFLEGMEINVLIEHSAPDKNGRVWANATTPSPIGSQRGDNDPEYEARGRSRFQEMLQRLGQLDIVAPPPAPKYDEQGSLIDKDNPF